MIPTNMDMLGGVQKAAVQGASDARETNSDRGAFSEALNGARSVLDQRNDHRSDRAERSSDNASPTSEAAKAINSKRAENDTEAAPTATSDSATETPSTDAPAESTTVKSDDAPASEGETDSDAEATTKPATTAGTGNGQTTAVDSAVRLAIGAQAEGSAETEGEATKVATTVVATDEVEGDAEADVKLQNVSKLQIQGTEDETSDNADKGPKRTDQPQSKDTSGPRLGTQVSAAATAAAHEGKPGDAAQAVHAAKLASMVEGEVDVDATQGKVATSTAATATAAASTTTKTGQTQVDETVQLQVIEGEGEDALDTRPAAVKTAAAAKANVASTQTASAAANPASQARAEVRAAKAAEDVDVKVDTAQTQPSNVSQLAPAGAAKPEVTFGQRVAQFAQAQDVQERIDHIASQLSTRLKMSAAAGGTDVKLSLRPRELGEVTVKMQVREGVVAATILVDRADTVKLLQSNLDDLRRSLENQGLSVQEFNVNVRDGGESSSTSDQRDNGATAASPTGTETGIDGDADGAPGLSGDNVVTQESNHDGSVSVLA